MGINTETEGDLHKKPVSIVFLPCCALFGPNTRTDHPKESVLPPNSPAPFIASASLMLLTTFLEGKLYLFLSNDNNDAAADGQAKITAERNHNWYIFVIPLPRFSQPLQIQCNPHTRRPHCQRPFSRASRLRTSSWPMGNCRWW